MRMRILPVLVLLGCSTKLPAVQFPVEVIEFMDNARVVASIEAVDIDASAQWQPFSGAPPLSLTAALDAVHKHLAADPTLADATLSGIELKQIPHHENHWHYLVKLQAHNADNPRPHYFIVLMNGKVIAGLREPQAVK